MIIEINYYADHFNEGMEAMLERFMNSLGFEIYHFFGKESPINKRTMRFKLSEGNRVYVRPDILKIKEPAKKEFLVEVTYYGSKPTNNEEINNTLMKYFKDKGYDHIGYGIDGDLGAVSNLFKPIQE